MPISLTAVETGRQALRATKAILQQKTNKLIMAIGETTTLLPEIETQLHNMFIAADNDTILLVTPPGNAGGLLSVKRSDNGFCHIYDVEAADLTSA